MPGTSSPLIVFAHGNGFPGGTYGTLFRSLRARGWHVKAVDRFGHDPRWPVTPNWTQLVQQLAEFATEAASGPSGPLVLVGHSLGGFLSVMCAALHPVLGGREVSGVVLLDSPLIGGWRAKVLEAVQRTQLVGSLSPGRVSRKRRRQWPDEQAALAHFQHKRAFMKWDPQALKDYVAHGTEDEATPQGTRRALRFDRDIETRIYNTLPHNLDRLLRRHALRCPVAFIGGTESQELRQVGLTLTRKVVDAAIPHRMQMLEGTHLFPLERPLDTAAAIERAIASFQAAGA
jgi:pimeloyl-ACP methyl ester carboxylesterase